MGWKTWLFGMTTAALIGYYVLSNYSISADDTNISAQNKNKTTQTIKYDKKKKTIHFRDSYSLRDSNLDAILSYDIADKKLSLDSICDKYHSSSAYDIKNRKFSSNLRTSSDRYFSMRFG